MPPKHGLANKAEPFTSLLNTFLFGPGPRSFVYVLPTAALLLQWQS